ncbi:lysostaphin resistance A-like protein [Actinomadura sp. 21ATH]|uniref:CPBP family intramembrane glutamic endopeptidase n=1 Tax=Actinomadura sp. 21ATH TaxID=1735444 RepID=UPI0035BF9734
MARSGGGTPQLRAVGPVIAPAAVAVVLVAANLLNNRLAPGAYVATCAAGAALLLLAARWDGCSWPDLGLGRDGLRRGPRWAAAAALLVLAVYTVAALLPFTRTAFEDERAGGSPFPEVLYNVLVHIPLGTVLLEEVAFRGVLYAMLARRYGVPKAVAGSSLLFGFWHVLPSLNLASRNAAVESLAGTGTGATAAAVTAAVVVTALGGAVFCELRRRSGSLLAPMGLHWALNGIGFAFAAALASG